MGLATAANAAYRASKTVQMEYQGTCTVCGGACKASARQDSYLTCQGCSRPFHTSKCGVYYACGKCLLQSPEDARTEFIAWMRRRTSIGNFTAYGVFLPSTLILVGMILVFYGMRAMHWSILIVLVPFCVALGFLASSGSTMRQRATDFFGRYPVKIVDEKAPEGSALPHDGAGVQDPGIDKAKAAAIAAIQKTAGTTSPNPHAPLCKWCGRPIINTKLINCPHCSGNWH